MARDAEAADAGVEEVEGDEADVGVALVLFDLDAGREVGSEGGVGDGVGEEEEVAPACGEKGFHGGGSRGWIKKECIRRGCNRVRCTGFMFGRGRALSSLRGGRCRSGMGR